MATNQAGEWQETFVEQTVRYILEKDGRLFVIENVPARVSVETGEQLFSPETVERIQRTIWGEGRPARVLETPVYEFAACTAGRSNKALHRTDTAASGILSSQAGCSGSVCR